MEKTCYDILGVRPDASRFEIRAAFRRLARRCHPDTAAPGEVDQIRLQQLLAAYRLLSSPRHRARYDARLEAVRAPGFGRWPWGRLVSYALRLRRLAAFCSSARVPVAVPAVAGRRRPARPRTRPRCQEGPCFEQVLAGRLRAEASCYVLCEDGIIRRNGPVAEFERTARPRRTGLSGALWLCLGGLVALMVGCWELVSGEIVLR